MLNVTTAEPHFHARILYAEDVRELRDLTRLVLTRDGHSVECANDGADALEAILAQPDAYDVVITDHHMPRMRGLDLVIELRKIGFKGKILVFSSELNPSVAEEYHRLAVDRVLFKPVYPSALRQAVADLFAAAHA
ncbi:MAG TPA: response regulator [Opitutaceae bacterium]|nr:response regulator [Opitutaceae bacterium]